MYQVLLFKYRRQLCKGSMSLAVTEFSINRSPGKPCNFKTLQWAEVSKDGFRKKVSIKIVQFLIN